VVRAARRVGLGGGGPGRAVTGRPLLWVNDPSGARVLAATGWPALYDVTDDWLAAVRTPAETRRLRNDEALLLRDCHEVVVCSTYLARTKGANRPVTLVPNAVDLVPYQGPVARPADLPSSPVAVYVGTVHTDRIDVDLCVDVARALGPGRLVLVGPAPLPRAEVERLVGSGVVLLGAKDRHDVPAYLRHADVLLVPHVVTPFTESLDPIKLYEYRAAGRPVISTPVAGFRETDDPLVTVVGRADYAAAVRDAVATAVTVPTVDAAHGGPSAEPGSRAPASEPVPTWTERVTEMRAVLDRMVAP
jgi:teichuronic acid biosynthesis glycosyltransferase TuaH